MPSLSGRLQTLLFRIILGFSLITGLFIAILLFSLNNARQSQQAINAIEQDAVPLLSVSAEQATLLQTLEPKLIALIDAGTESDLAQARAALSDQLVQTLQMLSDNQDLSGGGSGSTAQSIQTTLSQAVGRLQTDLTTLVERQQQWLQTRQQFIEASQTLDKANADFRTAIDDIVYEIYDDYLISLIQEMSASANYGQVLIEKLKAATDPENAEQIGTELTTWIRDFDAYTGMLPVSIEENNELYRAFVASVADISETIRTTAQGEYNNDINDYENGLISIKHTQLDLMQTQQDSLETWLSSIQSMLATNESHIEVGLTELHQITEQSAIALRQQERLGRLSGAATLLFVIGISLYLTRQFRRSVQSIQTPLGQLAEGDLSGEMPVAGQDEFGRILSGIARVKAQLTDIVTGLSRSNQEIQRGIENLDEQINSTRQNIGNQANELDMVATALTQMAGTATEVAQHASDTHQQLSQAEQTAQQGRETVIETRERVQAVDAQTRSAADALSRLTGGVDRISSILSTIQGIAEQTNLLALNAAIEAARAGEQGRGFAVVADEVRQLAGRTSGATDEIQQMIDTMQTDSNNAVEAMNQNLNRVSDTLTSSEKTEATIDRMTDLMSGVIDLSHLIATASEEQAATVNEINRNILQVSGLGEQTLEAADVMQQRSEALKVLSDELNDQVRQFRT
ncbi:methyl-accepting chemotaxis protein [Reinekea blandensis]|uniref:Chemotaxis sensory transducer n=1 Tax=Reinekea blandensis MED297 TaxID=314283 RepID=A4BA75_9GAMM|nr:methyl-accepting chemotaxis protein [Reinekea blandensis]EAR10831.1 chemotaxis sensory transducer [Reinekea sp. MED297] [Reinekea blandensis MED297]